MQLLIRNMNLRGSILVCLLLAGCGSRPALVLPYFAPYKMDVQQGNVVTQEMISKIQPGMTRNQVRFALGTPLVVDPFRTDRWDYVYQYHKGGVMTEQRRIAVIFKDDKLLRIEGDVVPASPGGSAPGSAKSGQPAASTEVGQGAKPENPGGDKPAGVKPAN